MNKQELEKQAEALYTDVRSFLDNTFELIDQIHQPQKVVVPNLIGKWIETCKTSRLGGQLNTALQGPGESFNDSEAINIWLEYPGNQETFARAWLDGYQVERERLYTVEIPNPHSGSLTVLEKFDDGTVFISQMDAFPVDWRNHIEYQLTEAEIKQDFEWAWDAGFMKEVER